MLIFFLRHFAFNKLFLYTRCLVMFHAVSVHVVLISGSELYLLLTKNTENSVWSEAIGPGREHLLLPLVLAEAF